MNRATAATWTFRGDTSRRTPAAATTRTSARPRGISTRQPRWRRDRPLGLSTSPLSKRVVAKPGLASAFSFPLGRGAGSPGTPRARPRRVVVKASCPRASAPPPTSRRRRRASSGSPRGSWESTPPSAGVPWSAPSSGPASPPCRPWACSGGSARVCVIIRARAATRARGRACTSWRHTTRPTPTRPRAADGCHLDASLISPRARTGSDPAST